MPLVYHGRSANYHALGQPLQSQCLAPPLSTARRLRSHVARHPRTRRHRRRFRRTLAADRLASTYLFVGPAGIGKKRFALALAKSPAVPTTIGATIRSNPAAIASRADCSTAGNHPDLDVVGLPKDKSTLPLELFIGDKEHRNQDGLCHRISLRPFLGGRKVAIIDDADHFSQESANCLLKTLEEPPPRSLMILIGTSPSKQLPTIRSRSQVVRFQPLPASTRRRDSARRREWQPTRRRPSRLATYSEGSIERAVRARRTRAVAVSRTIAARSVDVGQPNAVRMAQVDADVCRRGGQRGARAANGCGPSSALRRSSIAARCGRRCGGDVGATNCCSVVARKGAERIGGWSHRPH